MVAVMFTPSVGALGIGGVIAFALGATILIDTDMPAFTVDWPVIALMAALSLGFIFVVLRLALRARRRPVVTGPEQMLGAPARVLDWEGPVGHVLVHGERWQAAAADPARVDQLHIGSAVRVTRLQGLTLVVRPQIGREHV